MRRTPNLARSEGSRVKEGVTKFACTSFPKTSGFYGIARHGRFPIPSDDEHTVVGVVCVLKHVFSLCEGGSLIFHNFSLRNKSQQTASNNASQEDRSQEEEGK